MEKEKIEIICLTGSSKFFDKFMEINYEQTLLGKLVLPLGVYRHYKKYNSCTIEQIKILDKIQKYKINLCDILFVINVNGYVGKKTKEEILYAKNLNKKIQYLEKEILFPYIMSSFY